MTEAAAHEAVDRLFREESGRVVATLIRVLGDFDLAEEAVQDAFARAVEVWPAQGVPRNPGAWITTTARNAAIDRIRRRRRLAEKTEELRREAEIQGVGAAFAGEEPETDGIDDRLRLIFTCCHPALAPEARVALTLRTLGGLTTPGDRPRLPRPRGDARAAAGPGEAEDPRRRASRTASRHPRSFRSGSMPSSASCT